MFIPGRVRDMTITGRHGAPKARAYQSLGQRPRNSSCRRHKAPRPRAYLRPGAPKARAYRQHELPQARGYLRPGAPKARAYQSLGQRPRKSFANIRPGLKARSIPGESGFQPLFGTIAGDLGRGPRLVIERAFGPLPNSRGGPLARCTGSPRLERELELGSLSL